MRYWRAHPAVTYGHVSFQKFEIESKLLLVNIYDPHIYSLPADIFPTAFRPVDNLLKMLLRPTTRRVDVIRGDVDATFALLESALAARSV